MLGHVFHDRDAVITFSNNILTKTLTKQFNSEAFDKLLYHYEKCVQLEGDYVEKHKIQIVQPNNENIKEQMIEANNMDNEEQHWQKFRKCSE
jgi:hypothetical protein